MPEKTSELEALGLVFAAVLIVGVIIIEVIVVYHITALAGEMLFKLYLPRWKIEGLTQFEEFVFWSILLMIRGAGSLKWEAKEKDE